MFRLLIGLTQKSSTARATNPECGPRPGKVRIYDECDPCMHAKKSGEGKRSKGGMTDANLGEYPVELVALT